MNYVVSPTPLDLEFSLLGVPVRISAWFWAAGTFLGFGALKAGVPFLMMWLLVLFVSILVHEMGHALAARYFGQRVNILLYHFGGLAFHSPAGRHLTLTQSILVSLAGPMAGFAFFALIMAFEVFGVPMIPRDMGDAFWQLLSFALIQLIYINLAWGLVNLLPVLPLDGGQICRDVCRMISPFNGVLYAIRIGVVAAGGVALLAAFSGNTFVAILFAILCANNIQMLQAGGRW